MTQQVGRGVLAQLPAQGRVAVECGQFAQQVARRGEQRRVPGQHRLVAQVAGAHRLAHAVGADQHDVAGVLEEVQRHQFLDGAAVDALGPGPVEVGQRLEAPDVGRAQPPLQAAPAALGGLPGQHLRHPARLLGLAHHLGPVGLQAVQAKCAGLLAQLGLRWAWLQSSSDLRLIVSAVAVVRAQGVGPHRRVAPCHVLGQHQRHRRAAGRWPRARAPAPGARRWGAAHRAAAHPGWPACSAGAP